MNDLILGLHHVTATADDAQEDLDCYVKALGMRLVKKTVNFDNHNVYHFYYGDEHGQPNTLMTTFPYKGWGVPVGIHGAGQITATLFSVPAGALDAWRQRLQDAGYPIHDAGERFGDEVLELKDPSGLVIELTANDDDDRMVDQVNYAPPSVYGYGHLTYYGRVLDVLKGHSEPDPDGRTARKSLEINLAIYKSARDNVRVALPFDGH